MPNDPAVAVELLLAGEGAGWGVDELERLRRAVADEHIGPDRAAALAAIDRLLG